jgi:DNA-binding beta-propeller fold protein YncE
VALRLATPLEENTMAKLESLPSGRTKHVGSAGLGLGVLVLGLLPAVVACGGASPHPEGASARRPAAAATGSCARVRPGTGPVRADAKRQGSSVAVVREGGRTFAYVADEDSKAIHTIDVEQGVEVATARLEGAPAQLLVLADGRVAATLRDKNRLAVLEPAAHPGSLEVRCTVPVAVEPFGLAATPNDEKLMVTSAMGRTVTALDSSTMKVAYQVPVAREPRAIVVDDDGQRAFVAHVVGGKMSVVDLVGDEHAVREIDLRVKKVLGQPSRFSDADKTRSGCQGFALAKSVDVGDDSKHVEKPLVNGRVPKAPAPAKPKGRIFAPMVTVDPGEAMVRSNQYYGEVRDGVPKEAPIVSVIDADAERPLTKTVMSLGSSSRMLKECLLPRSATALASGTLLVSCLGIDSIVELDTRGTDPVRLERRRWQVPAGPTGVAVDEVKNLAVVWSQFDGRASILDLGSDRAAQWVEVSYAPSKEVAAIAAGRKLFHAVDDDRISSDGTACASCHPDGREDALTWSTPDGPRQTIMLAGRAATSAPYGWMGRHDTLKSYVSNTFTRLGGSGMANDDLEALVSYVHGMPGPTSEAAPLEAARRELHARGKDLFFDRTQGCASCHVGGVGVDSKNHDIGSHTAADVIKEFDTPSLRFIDGTAPYFHDGRYKTIAEVLEASDTQMGHTMHLSQRDKLALATYLETL